MTRKLAFALIGGTTAATTVIIPSVILNVPNSNKNNEVKISIQNLEKEWNNLGTNDILYVSGVGNVSANLIDNWDKLAKVIKATSENKNSELKQFITNAESISANFSGSIFSSIKSDFLNVQLKITVAEKSITTKRLLLTGFAQDNKPPNPEPTPQPDPNQDIEKIANELNNLAIKKFSVIKNIALNKTLFQNPNTNVLEFLFNDKIVFQNDNEINLLKTILNNAWKNKIILRFENPIVESFPKSQNISFGIKLSKGTKTFSVSGFNVLGFQSSINFIYSLLNNLIEANFIINLSGTKADRNGYKAYDLLTQAFEEDINGSLTYKALFGTKANQTGILSSIANSNENVKELKKIFDKAIDSGVAIKVYLIATSLSNLYSSTTNKTGSVSFKFEIADNISSTINSLKTTKNLKITNFEFINATDIAFKIDNLINQAQKSKAKINNPYGNIANKAEIKIKAGINRNTLNWTKNDNSYYILFGKPINNTIAGVLNIKYSDVEDPFKLIKKIKSLMESNSSRFKYKFENLDLNASGANSQKADLKLKVIALKTETTMPKVGTCASSLVLKGFNQNAQSIAYQIQKLITDAKTSISSQNNIYNLANNLTSDIDLVIQPQEPLLLHSDYTNWSNESATTLATDAYNALFVFNINSEKRDLPNGVLQKSLIENKSAAIKNDPFNFAIKLKKIMENNKDKYSFSFTEGAYKNKNHTQIVDDFWFNQGFDYKRGVWFKIKVSLKKPVENERKISAQTDGKITLIQDKK